MFAVWKVLGWCGVLCGWLVRARLSRKLATQGGTEGGRAQGPCHCRCRSPRASLTQESPTAPSEIPLHSVLEFTLNSVPSKAFLTAGMNRAKLLWLL